MFVILIVEQTDGSLLGIVDGSIVGVILGFSILASDGRILGRFERMEVLISVEEIVENSDG